MATYSNRVVSARELMLGKDTGDDFQSQIWTSLFTTIPDNPPEIAYCHQCPFRTTDPIAFSDHMRYVHILHLIERV